MEHDELVWIDIDKYNSELRFKNNNKVLIKLNYWLSGRRSHWCSECNIHGVKFNNSMSWYDYPEERESAKKWVVHGLYEELRTIKVDFLKIQKSLKVIDSH